MRAILLGTMQNIPALPGGTARIFLSAGEASGDHYGAQIIAGLRAQLREPAFAGLGGTAMEQAGQHRVVHAEDVAHMGLTEVIRHAPYIYAQYRKLVRSVRRDRPDVAVLIDFPDVNFRLAKHLKRAGVPVVWFVSPQLWAWKRRRLRWVQQRVDRMLVIFPFEEPFYRVRGVQAEFVGHPLASLEIPTSSREEYVDVNMAGDSVRPEGSSHLQRPWVALLPGSRWKEIAANLPTMLAGAALLGPGYDFLIPVANTIDKSRFSDFIFKELLPELGWPASSITLVPDAREALHFARAAVVASGTATVQALTIGNPFIIIYRVSRLSFAVLKRLVHYPPEIPAQVDQAGNLPVGMVNLIAGKRIVPELLNDRFSAENVAAALRPLLQDTPERARMMADLATARSSLAGADPIGKVCAAVMELLPKST